MMKLTTSLSSPNSLALLVATSKLAAFSITRPVKLEIDDHTPAVTSDWAAELSRTKIDGCAYWENQRKQIEIRPKSDLVTLSIPDGFSSIDEALSILAPLPFEIGAFKSPFSTEWLASDRDTWGFSRSHVIHK